APVVELSESIVQMTSLAIHAAFVVPLLCLSLRLRAAGATEPQGPRGDELALYLLYSTVLSPYSWKYYFVNLTFPLAAALQRLWESRAPSLEAGLWTVFLLNQLPARDLVGRKLATALQLGSFHFVAAALLFVVLAREAFRSAALDVKPDDRGSAGAAS
ncbi:MAG: hypothetical protein ACREQQ_15715, partial [Candidatus Binatia bacterium]